MNPGEGQFSRKTEVNAVTGVVTAQEFARLNTFEAFMMMFDGVGTVFKKLYLKPYYLKDKRMPHRKILASLRPALSLILAAIGLIGSFGVPQQAQAFPNVCTVLKSSESSSCMNFSVGMCMCGWPIPRPCANFSYYVPTSFRTTPSSGDEFWQMIYPQTSSCFREGQNVGILDATKNVREIGRLTSGKFTGYLFTVWSKVSCCRDLALVPEAYAALAAMNLACQGLGAL